MASRTAHDPFEHSAPPPLAGRERERRALDSALATAIAGSGRLVLIAGDAGIGKTTLVQAIAAEARARGALVLRGHCYEMALPPPYGPWLEAAGESAGQEETAALRSLIAPGAAGSASELFADIRVDLQRISADRPLVIALEDMHWSDPTSVELLRFVALDVAASRLLLLITYRPEDLSHCPALSRALPRIMRESRVMRLDLQPLTDAEARSLVRGSYALGSTDEDRLVAHVQANAGGNPFFLTELLRTLEHERIISPVADHWVVGDLAAAPIPPVVRQLIANRLESHAEPARNVLDVAAVIGQLAPLAIVQAVWDGSSDLLQAVEAACASGMLSVTPDGLAVRYSHALVRDAVYQTIPMARRREVHRQVAGVLAARPDPPLSDIASHLERAHDPAALDWLARAGEQALARFAPHDAIDALTRAHDLAGRFNRELPLPVYRARALAYATVGEFDRARHDNETVLNRSRVTGDSSEEWQVLHDLALLWTERDYERAGVYCRAALDLARQIDDPGLIAHSLNRIANWHINQEDPLTALPLHNEALVRFEHAGDRQGIAHTLDLLGMASYLGCDLAASASYYERAIPVLRELGDRRHIASCLAALSVTGGDLDCAVAMPVYREPAFWLASAEEALAVAREIDWPAGQALANFVLANVTAVRGALDRALRHVTDGIQIAERIQHREWEVACRHTHAVVLHALLDVERARQEMERALALARQTGSRFWINTTAASLALLHIDAGDLNHAAALLDTLSTPAGPSMSMGQRQCLYVRAKLAVAQHEPLLALAMVDDIVRHGTSTGSAPRTPQLNLLRGEALALLGRSSHAEDAFVQARQDANLFGFLPIRWQVENALASLYRAGYRDEAAAGMSRAARDTLDLIAATLEDASVREHFLSRRAQRSASLSADHSPAASPLSRREMDVLRLLVDGSTDREIAGALNISPRTVHRHVTSIFNKLGVNTRTAAASIALRQGIL